MSPCSSHLQLLQHQLCSDGNLLHTKEEEFWEGVQTAETSFLLMDTMRQTWEESIRKDDVTGQTSAGAVDTRFLEVEQ